MAVIKCQGREISPGYYEHVPGYFHSKWKEKNNNKNFSYMFDSPPNIWQKFNLGDSTETVIGHQFTFNGWLLLGNLFGEQNNHIKLLTQTFIPGWAIYCFQQVAKGAKHCLEGLDEGKFHFPLLNIRWCWQNAGNFLEGKVSWTSQVSKLFQIHDYCCYGTFHTVRGCAFSSNMSRDLTSRSLR